MNPVTGREKIDPNDWQRENEKTVLICLYHIQRRERQEQGEIVVKEGKYCL